MDWHRVCAAAELPGSGVRGAAVPAPEGERWIVVCRTVDGLHATDGVCTHAEARLDEGRFRNGRLTCPMHGAAFDCRTGAALSGPARAALRVHEVRERDGAIEVRLAG